MSAEETIEPGQTVENRYRIEEEIGRGAMGVVYRAHDPVFSCDRAFKILRSDQIDNEDTVRRFREEGRAAVRASGDLAHPNIVTVYDAGEYDGRPYIIMELFKGEPLDAVMAGEASIPVSSVIRLATQLADALASAHAHGVVHRDVKPANIMMSPDRAVAKLTDFSVARMKSGDDHAATKTGVVIGAPRYMSPEQALAKGVDGRSDLYSLGVVLYELLTGRKAFRSDTITALLIEITRDDPEPVRKLAPHVSPGLEHIVAKLLEKDPTRRFQSGEELATALRREEQNLSNRDARKETGLPPEVRAAGLLAAIVAAIMIIGGSLLYNRLTDTARTQTAESAVALGDVLGRMMGNASDNDPLAWSFSFQGIFSSYAENIESVSLIRVTGLEDDPGLAARLPFDNPRDRNCGQGGQSWAGEVIAESDASGRVIQNLTAAPGTGGRAPVAIGRLDGVGEVLTVRTVSCLRRPDDTLGFAETLIAVPTTPLRDAARLTLGLLTLLTLMTVGAVGSLAYLATRRFASPMTRLRDALKDLAIGDTDVRLSGGQGLVSETYDAFNAVAAQKGGRPAPATDDLLDALSLGSENDDASDLDAGLEDTHAETRIETREGEPSAEDGSQDAGEAPDTEKTAIFTPNRPAGE
ncbi:MAG: serine/threonine-protein kinase [Pseudomonadota bacterium]